MENITCLQTAFAQDTYGIGYEEKLSSMSDRIGSILAVNGDSYSNDRHQDNGTIIRNGIIYRDRQTNVETCVLNWDGTMKIYRTEELDINQLVEEGACQSWIFGPSLLEDSRIIQEECFWKKWQRYLKSSDVRQLTIWTEDTALL